MRIEEELTYSTLGWVKQELNATLGDAREALETHADKPDGGEHIRRCAESLHQVQGTLRMVELYGAALVAEEMEQVAIACAEGEIEQAEEAYGVLMRGIMQLPDYLDRLASGHRDIPMVLLSLLNDLRTTRGGEAMAESTLFAPRLEVDLPDQASGPNSPVENEELKSEVARLRLVFQGALVRWFKAMDADQALARMRQVLDELVGLSYALPARRLWWVAAAVVEGLGANEIETSPSVKKHIGAVDRQIKRLLDEGEDSFIQEPADDLTRSLLYYVAYAQSRTPRMEAVRDAFRLGELVPDSAEMEHARGAMSGHNRELLMTVGGAIKEDLLKVKDALDLYLRTGKREPEELGAQAEALGRVADTLGMLGLGEQREHVQERRETLSSMAAGAQEADEATLMEVASALLFVEASLEDYIDRLGAIENLKSRGDGASEPGTLELPRAEMQRINQALLGEAAQNLSQAKESIVAFIEAPWDHARLGECPVLLEQVIGALRMLDQSEPAELLGGVVQYLKRRLIEPHAIPSAEELDILADALESLAYYLGGLADHRPGADDALELARRRVAELDFAQMPPAEQVEDDLTSEEPDGITAVDITTTLPDAAGGRQSVASVSELGDDTQNVETRLSEEIDDDIREVFVEEVTEELQNLRRLYPRWKADSEDVEPLITIRRVFHTLKGSGRLVGAHTLGEFSWKIENMLNRVLDDSREATPAVFALMDRVVFDALPQLLDDLKGEAAIEIDVDAYAATADAIAAGEEAELPTGAIDEAEPAIETERQAEPGEAPTESDTALMDEAFDDEIEIEGLSEEELEADISAPDDAVMDEPVPEESLRDETPADGIPAQHETEEPAMEPGLYQVFRKEAGAHLLALGAFLNHARPHPEKTPVNEELTRSLHTLHGAAAMADVEPLVALASPMESYVKRLQVHDDYLSREGFEVLEAALQSAERIVDEAGKPVPDYPDTAELVAGLHKLSEAVPEEEVSEAVWAGEAVELVDETPGTIPEGESTQTEAVETGEEETLEEAQAPEEPEEVEVAETPSEAEDDLDRELLEIFLQEGEELLDEADGLMQRWRADSSDREPVAELQRDLHTLKGGARMADLHGMGDLGHVLESLFEAIGDGRVQAGEAVFECIEAALDHLHRDLEKAQRDETPVYPSQAIADIHALLGGEAEVEGVSGFEGSMEAELEEPAQPRRVRFTQEDVEKAEAAQRQQALAGQQEAVRVRADLLDNLVNYAGEISIYRGRLEQQVGAFRFNLVELAQTVTRLREQLRKLEIETEAQILSRLQREGALPEDAELDLERFDPLELDRFSQLQQYSRALAESVTDLVNIEDILSGLTRESETLLLQQSRINSDLQEGLMRTRMVPFSSQVPRLRRLLRRTADELGRKATLEVVGAEGEMDRTVLERMAAPLDHMIRNALAHGIESPEERKKAGKPEQGLIRIALRREASEVVVEVGDDGRGIDLEAVRKTAVKRGLLKKDAELTDHDTLGFILETGFSTAEEVSKVAGRGVGMDVVHAEIKQLSGTLDINSHTGQGTQFTIRLPFTLAVTQGLMVRVGDENYAVPLSGIEGVVRVERDEFINLLQQGEGARLSYGGEDYEVQDLAVLLGRDPQHTGDQAFVPVLIVRSGDRHAAVRVDELLGSREVVVKSVGPQLSTVPGIFGATILGDGSVILILDLLPLVRRGAALHLLPEEMRAAREEVERDLRPTIMVVDDSITMRKVTSRILERHDMQVLTAKDGVDAVALLQESLPDVMLLDIEMPRMDGYELATHIRNDSRLKNIPIIMITSRTGSKHRERAEGLGVNKYMGKPYQEADLMQHINELLDEERRAV